MTRAIPPIHMQVDRIFDVMVAPNLYGDILS